MPAFPSQISVIEYVCLLISTGSAFFGAVMSAVQFRSSRRMETIAERQEAAAKESLAAAWQIAEDQKKRADEAEALARERFVRTVKVLGEGAAQRTKDALVELSGRASPDIGARWRLEMLDFKETLDAVRPSGPPDSELLLAVTRLSKAMHVGDIILPTVESWRSSMDRHRDLLLKELKEVS